MPNGVSCAYFAVRNHVYGKNENNIFKKGIAGAQSVRTADTVAHSSMLASHVASPVKSFFSSAAALARKIVYPLIIASGIFNTIKSDDKVRTGVSQASGIGTMYAFEQASEQILKNLDKKILSSNAVKNCKPLKYVWYVAKGMSFVCASLAGYSIGSDGGEAIVDRHRSKKTVNADKKETQHNTEIATNTAKFPLEADLKPENVEATLFADMIL